MTSKQITGNAGMYYACYQLSRLGLNVMPTARNAKGADVIAYTLDHARFLTFQVKAMTRSTNIQLGKSLDAVGCDWWIVIANVYAEPTAYILTPAEVCATARLYDGQYWAQSKQFDTPLTRNAWQRIGHES